jgi:hypothetical protein
VFVWTGNNIVRISVDWKLNKYHGGAEEWIHLNEGRSSFDVVMDVSFSIKYEKFHD